MSNIEHNKEKLSFEDMKKLVRQQAMEQRQKEIFGELYKTDDDLENKANEILALLQGFSSIYIHKILDNVKSIVSKKSELSAFFL